MSATVAEELSAVFVGVQGDIARRIHACANRVGAMRTRFTDEGFPDHEYTARLIVHEVAGLLGNLMLERLIEAAGTADRAARSEQ